MPIEEPGKLHIDPLAKISIFGLWFIGIEKIGLARSLLGWAVEVKKVLADKIEEIFCCIYFIYIYSHSKANRGAG